MSVAASTRWEYTVVDSFDRLSALGEDGWELVGVTNAGGNERFYLKRRLPSLREQITLDQRKQALGKAGGGSGE